MEDGCQLLLSMGKRKGDIYFGEQQKVSQNFTATELKWRKSSFGIGAEGGKEKT